MSELKVHVDVDMSASHGQSRIDLIGVESCIALVASLLSLVTHYSRYQNKGKI